MTARITLGRSLDRTTACELLVPEVGGGQSAAAWFGAVFAALINRYNSQQDFVLAGDGTVRICRVRPAGQSVAELAAELVGPTDTGPAPRVAFSYSAPVAFDEFDLVLDVRGTCLTCHYDGDMFAPEFVEWLIAEYRRLLAAVARRPSAPIRELAELDSGRVTFGRLDVRANRLARALLHNGVTRGDRVGVSRLRHPAQLAALVLAIRKAGCHYVPLADVPPAAGQVRAVVFDRDLVPSWLAAVDALALSTAALREQAAAERSDNLEDKGE